MDSKPGLINIFQEIDDRLNESYTSNDVSNISNLLADDWYLLEPSFGIITKQQFLQSVEKNALMHLQMKKQVLQVKMHNDIAVVITRGFNIGTYNNEPFNAAHWVTNIYQKINEQWLCIMTQEAPVMCK